MKAEPLVLTHQWFPAALHRPLWWVWERSLPIVSQLKFITQMPLSPLMQFPSCQAGEGWSSQGAELSWCRLIVLHPDISRLGWSRTDLIICLPVLCTPFSPTCSTHMCQGDETLLHSQGASEASAASAKVNK